MIVTARMYRIYLDETIEEVKRLIHDAVEFHLEGLKESGEPIPTPTSSIEFIEVAA